MDDKIAFSMVIDFIYSFLDLQHDYFGVTLSFRDILFGLFCLSVVITVWIRLME